MSFPNAHTATRTELVHQIAVRLTKPLPDDPIKFYKLPLAKHQTHDRASAEWYATTSTAMWVGIKNSLVSYEKAAPILAAFQELIQPKLSPGCLRTLGEIGPKRVEEYAREIYKVVPDRPDKFTDLCIKIAGRIIGKYDEFSEATQHSPDVWTVSQLVAGVLANGIVTFEELFDSLQVTTPRAFSDD